MIYKVLDTNIPLMDATNLLNIGREPGVTVVLPETVLAELDAKKSGFEEVNWQARATARLLANGTVLSMTTTDFGTVSSMDIQGAKLELVSLNNYVDSSSEYGGNDRRIIQTAKVLTETRPDDEVIIISSDFYVRWQALCVGVKAEDLKIVDDSECEYVKSITIDDPEVFRMLHNSSIHEVDPDYKLENYSYKFSHDGRVKLATIANGFISVLGKETEADLRKQDCAPINAEQLLTAKAIQDPSIDLIMIEGQAGSGKNVTALSNAIRLLRTSKNLYESIVYIRTPQNDESPGEDIGYLSGNDEKLAMYLGPMEDTLDFIVRQNIKQKSGEKRSEFEERVADVTDNLKKECRIESIISTGLRGRTLHNCIVILDEWQNSSQATAQKVLTRAGKNCKVIVTGSQRQIDNKYVTRFNNGLAVLMDEARHRNIDTDINMFAIELSKVVRGKMAKFAEDLFSSK